MPENLCPCCGRVFLCKPSDRIENCFCSELKISKEVLIFLNNGYKGQCLCRDCLFEFEKLNQIAKKSNIQDDIPLVKGLHYYEEGGRMVFTALYLFQRGYCCGNGCRHCVYQGNVRFS